MRSNLKQWITRIWLSCAAVRLMIVEIFICILTSVGAAASSASDSVYIHRAEATIIINGNPVMVGSGHITESPIVGDGKIVTEKREVNAVAAVRLEGAFTATINIGRGPILVLSGDDNILPAIKIENTRDQLRIFADQSYSAAQPVRVDLSLPSLAHLVAIGSNSVSASGIEVPEMVFTTRGANSVILSGHTKMFSGTLDGSGQLAAATLSADTVTIRISGSGSATVNAHSKVIAEINGSGTIEVHGHPAARESQTHGSGSIHFVD